MPKSQCFDETGKPPIPLKWVDTNKGDVERPNYRSRLVVREIKAKKTPEEKLEIDQLFSSMPPLEALMLLISEFTTLSRQNYKLAMFDISRAHFYGVAQRRVFVELTDEDKKEFGRDKCGLLMKSMYGTQDASKIWQEDYVDLLSQAQYQRGPVSYTHLTLPTKA